MESLRTYLLTGNRLGYTNFMTKKYVVWFSQVGKEDIALVGGKGANLGEMTNSGFPVPPGFIVTAQAYYYFLKENNLQLKIKRLLEKLRFDNPHDLLSISNQVKKLILVAPIPKEIAVKIVDYYLELSLYIHSKQKDQRLKTKINKFFAQPYVAIRSSATAEDLPTASFAGQQETFLNVKGENNVLEKVRACWASLFEPRAIFYRHENKFDHFKIGIAVPVQKMINSRTSGVMFTVDPLNGDKKKIVIEAIFGLGEFIVQGIEIPDQYVVDKYEGSIISKNISRQEKMLVRKNDGNAVFLVPHNLKAVQKISDKQILKIAILGKKLERHYFFPQDIEWAIEDEQIFIVQTRPVTTIGKRVPTLRSGSRLKDVGTKPIFIGIGASPGIVTGPVRILKSSKEIYKIKPGEILVAQETNPDYVPAMRKAIAVVTEKGGRTSHAAIVSRELGIPAVVGASGILTKIKNEQIITVDGASGKIYRGNILKPRLKQSFNSTSSIISDPQINYRPIKTATKVYLNLAEPEKAVEAAKLPVDGVGLLRAEFMIADIGYHPKKLIKEHRQKMFIEKLSDGIVTFCKAFAPRPIIYRTTDFKTNEYRNLIGGKQFEPEESNPMLGFRGAFRYIASPEVFELECTVLKDVRNKMGYKNLHLMIPFVRTVKELIAVKKILAATGLVRSSTFKLWMMVEIPSNVILLDQFIDVGIDGVSVGSNDLTMLILGTDRDNTEVAKEFDERNEAVLWSLEKIIKTCHKRKITSSICGQAVSDYSDLVEKLIEWGVTSVSVNADAAVHTKQIVAQAERKLIQQK